VLGGVGVGVGVGGVCWGLLGLFVDRADTGRLRLLRLDHMASIGFVKPNDLETKHW
jgi:hypothetical protein